MIFIWLQRHAQHANEGVAGTQAVQKVHQLRFASSNSNGAALFFKKLIRARAAAAAHRRITGVGDPAQGRLGLDVVLKLEGLGFRGNGLALGFQFRQLFFQRRHLSQ